MENNQITNTSFKEFDLTQSQLMLWMGQQLNPDSPLYNMAFRFDFPFSIDIARFQQAFQLLIDRCDSMRTIFLQKEEQPIQRILSSFPYQMEWVDFSETADKTEQLATFFQQRSQAIFNIAECSFDSVLIKMSETNYAWYFNQHHLITDAWAVTLQYQLLLKIYHDELNPNKVESTPICPPFYENYITLENKEGRETLNDQASEYWNRQGKQLPDSNHFYANLNEAMDTRSERVTVQLTRQQVDRLRALTKEKDLRAWTEHLALFNIFSTLLFTLIYRLTGQEKMVIGTPTGNRSSTDFKNTPGIFIKMFPLMAEIATDDTFSSFLQKNKSGINEFLKYAQAGISTAELNKKFNVVLNYITASFGEINGHPSVSKWIHSGHADPRHHIRLQVHDFDEAGTIDLNFDFNCAVFDTKMRTSIPQQFLQLVDFFLANRFQSILTLSEEESTTLAAFNDHDVDFPKDKTIVDLFEEQVVKRGDEIAIVFEEKSWTFKELNQKSNQLAHYLLAQGVEVESLVAICLNRSLEMMWGLMGILKSGGAYVPIDPEYPKDRIRYVLENAKAKYIICSREELHLFEEISDVQLILIDEDWDRIAQQSMANPNTAIDVTNLVYVMYTSGSTGKPKGVMNQYDGVMNRLMWGQYFFQLDPEKDVFLQKTTFSFDLSVWELFWPMIAGMKLVFAKPGGHKDTNYLKKVIDQHQITIVHFVASMLEVFLLGIQEGDCSSLKRVICGGEALHVSTALNFQQKFPKIILYNLYGPTEAAMEVSMWPLPQKGAVPTIIPIGKPIANTKLLVLNPQGLICPIGIPGELHIAGIQVARGYFGRPKLTAEKFISNPFDEGHYSRMYKTGDLARWLPDGNVEFLGRLDSQVKIRGFRVELEEIEMVLKECTGVQRCVVQAVADQAGRPQLVAYVVHDLDFDQSATIAYLKAKLPAYMIPSFFIPMDQLPKTPNGKIDKAALPPISSSPSMQTTNYIEPATEFEILVHDIWSEVMQMDKISIHDSFLEIGGDSLSGIRVINRLNEALELDFPINIIFQKITIATLAEYVENTIKTLLEMPNAEKIE